ncbi:hypothetical protein [Pseudovibrio exalbescens]|uniref:hypothetical protein n=1 Tax=Pseudovibrio exalbescens TaxID=197461 RepID=UPI000C9B5E27|nr:hypothetical protein [Pseudovibrio exalbescens]
MNKTLPGKATILFSERGLDIEIHDESSAVMIEAHVGAQETLQALGRLIRVPCDVAWPDELDKIGKQLEVKRDLIPKDWGHTNTKMPTSEIEQRCKDAGLLQDGWFLWCDGNRVRQDSPGKHEVILRRYVNADQKGAA